MLGLKRTCFLERNTPGTDSGGSQTEAWATIKKFKGSLRSMRGKELFQFSREMANVTYKLTADYIADVTIADRLRIGSELYDIEHIDDTIPSKTKLYLERRV